MRQGVRPCDTVNQHLGPSGSSQAIVPESESRVPLLDQGTAFQRRVDLLGLVAGRGDREAVDAALQMVTSSRVLPRTP